MLRQVFILCVLSLLAAHCAEFPSYINKCKLNDAKLNDCLKEQANKFISNVKYGDVNLQIPSFNPVKVPRLLLTPTKGFQFDIRNCNAYGIEKLKILEIKINPKFQTLQFTFDAQNPVWQCTYRANGVLLNNTVDDRGFTNITFVNLSGEYTAEYDSTQSEVNGTSYYKVKNDALRFSMDKIVFNLAHRDGSDESQATKMNKILNEEYPDFEKEFIPSSRVISAGLITNVINKVFGSIPVDQLFESEIQSQL